MDIKLSDLKGTGCFGKMSSPEFRVDLQREITHDLLLRYTHIYPTSVFVEQPLEEDILAFQMALLSVCPVTKRLYVFINGRWSDG